MIKLRTNSDLKISFKSLFLSFVFILLISFHLLFIYSVTEYISNNGYSFVLKQGLSYIIMFFLILFIEFLIIRKIKKYSKKELFIKISILSLFFISMTIAVSLQILPLSYSYEINGVKRWLHLGFFNLAPIELIKISIIYFIANYYAQEENLTKGSIIDKKVIMFYVGLTVCFSAVLLKDLGSAAIIFSMLLIAIFLFSKRRKPIFQLLILGIMSLVALILLFPYRVKRIMSWFSSEGGGYQINQGFYAIYEGLSNSFQGVGYLEGVMKRGYIPEVHTDMVLPVLVSELGLVGYSLYVFLVSLMFYALFLILKGNKNMISYNLALLFMFSTYLSILINFLGVVGTIPFKGIAVPFLSYSGSNTIFNLGMVYLIIKFNKFDKVRISKELEKINADKALNHAWVNSERKEDKK